MDKLIKLFKNINIRRLLCTNHPLFGLVLMIGMILSWIIPIGLLVIVIKLISRMKNGVLVAVFLLWPVFLM